MKMEVDCLLCKDDVQRLEQEIYNLQLSLEHGFFRCCVGFLLFAAAVLLLLFFCWLLLGVVCGFASLPVLLALVLLCRVLALGSVSGACLGSFLASVKV
ncbi:hypothetical protein QYF36_026120 [Acer negundo]|nr:hypothetical protein QYF36_026120 [Acer negundo]